MLTLVLLVVVVILVILGLAATKPDSFRLERRTHIAAAPERVFALIDDFHSWAAWSPWEKLDPGMRRTHGGPASGVGATYAWEGNKKVGSGRMEIVESVPPSRLAVKLDFLRPFEAHNVAEFALVPSGGGTDVTWSMHGPSPFMSKVMQVFTSMDAMVGKDFEAGLRNLKAAAET
jgi:uncharacterized protein YndB with AHSA1/START domain